MYKRQSEYQLRLKDSDTSGNGAETALAFTDSGNTIQGFVGYNYWGDGNLDIQNNNSGGKVCINTGGGNERLCILSSGHSFHGGSVGIQTGNIDAANLANPVGAGHSLVGLYIGDGSLMFSSALSRTGGYYISTDVNALNAGPVTLNSNMKLDGTWVIV